MTIVCGIMTLLVDLTFTLHQMGKMKILFGVILCFVYEALCEEQIKSKNSLPYFRRHVEELSDKSTENIVADGLHSNLVSYLIQNVKEIYNELNDVDHKGVSSPITRSIDDVSSTFSSVSDYTPDGKTSDDTVEGTISDDRVEDKASDDTIEDTTTSSIDADLITESSIKTYNFMRKHIKPFRQYKTVTDGLKNITELDSGSIEKTDENDALISSTTELNTGSMGYTDENDALASHKNAALKPFSDKEIINKNPSTTASELAEKEELMHLSKNLILYETDRKERGNNELEPVSSLNATVLDNTSYTDKVRSCIYCNNVALENCNDPKHRLIPSTVCERDDDLCYSQHTPFGVIDRGCFNVNHNLTTYVCSCNLCNYISISEMPYIFSKKRYWVDNVVELSRTKHFRKSVLKGMSCLKCETNSTTKTGDMLDSANCLEGNIGSLPTQYCEQNEVCAVKAIRKYGYVWRGCVKFPLYNYWWHLCDSDLCNYDNLVSVFDPE